MNLPDHPDLVDRLAAAHALGTLRGGARRRFEALARQHASVRAAALLWQERLAAMTELQPAQAPSPNVWKRIQNMIEAQRSGAPGSPDGELLKALRRLLGLWRGAALAGGLATAAAVVVAFNLNGQVEQRAEELAQASAQASLLAQRSAQLAQSNVQLAAQLQAAPLIEYVAVLSDDKASASMLVTFDPRRNTLTLKRVGAYQEGPDKSLQLWALPPGGPRSLGVLGGDAVVRLTAAEAQVREVPALAISLEAKGGVPEGSGPKGPVLFKGLLLKTPT